jgi:tripartite-type tricarboxylate transporter receptor subunit TctC
MKRRDVLKAGAGSLAAAVTGWSAGPARANDWPTKPIRVVVPFTAGSAVDLVARAVFDQVSKQVGQPAVIENRPAGGGAIAINAVKSADHDGHTILAHSNSLITTPAIQAMAWDPPKDFSGITPLGNVPLVLVVSPDKNFKTLKDLVDAAKARPGSLNYAAAGIGSPPHLTMERFRIAAGFTGQLVPFRGAPEALTEIMGGRVDCYFCPLTPAMPLIQERKLVALAVSSVKRASALPAVPTTTEAGFPNSDFEFWIGAVVTKQTPRSIVDKIHAETVKAIENPATRERFSKMGVDALIESTATFDARIARETPIAIELAKAAGIGKS